LIAGRAGRSHIKRRQHETVIEVRKCFAIVTGQMLFGAEEPFASKIAPKPDF
jgi:hypothetical protein